MDQGNPKRFVAKVIFGGTITALTGMHIGGNDAGLGIGGADKLVVRDPRNSQPYVPGSSLKGRMRSLLEKVECAGKCSGFKVQMDAAPELGTCDCGECAVCLVFGVPASATRPFSENKPYAGAGRILVRDAFLSNVAELDRMRLDLPFTELKTEVSIDRLTSAANPRQFERVPAGAKFGFELTLSVFDGDDQEGHQRLVREGLALVADDALGGQSSRGYGQVEIALTHLAAISAEAYGVRETLDAARIQNTLTAPVIFGGRVSAKAA